MAYLHIIDVVAVPRGAKEFITETQDQDVLDHLFAKIVIDTEDLILLPVRFQCSL